MSSGDLNSGLHMRPASESSWMAQVKHPTDGELKSWGICVDFRIPCDKRQMRWQETESLARGLKYAQNELLS